MFWLRLTRGSRSAFGQDNYPARRLSGGCGGRVRRCVGAPVRSCGQSREFLRCWLNVRRRGSAVLSFCLDWKREGPVFIKVGGSPKIQAGSSLLVLPNVRILSVNFFFGTVHNAYFVCENPNYSKTPWGHHLSRVPCISDSNSHVFFRVL